MPTDIKLKNSVTATNAPTSLQQGEVAINITDKKVWVGNAATTPVLLLGSGSDASFTNISVSGVASFADGTVSLPSITNIGDTNTGIYFPAADTIAFTEGGVESMRIDSSGNLGVGVTSVGAKFQVLSAGATSATFCASFLNSGGFALFDVRNDGLISTGSRGASPYNNTTASAANMFVDSSGTLYRSTSSLKYKTDVQNTAHGLADVLKLRPVTYKGKTDGDTVFGGLIAEEVHEAGLTEFVQYAEDGTPDALAYGNMVSLAFKAIQELKATVDAQAARIAALESK